MKIVEERNGEDTTDLFLEERKKEIADAQSKKNLIPGENYETFPCASSRFVGEGNFEIRCRLNQIESVAPSWVTGVSI